MEKDQKWTDAIGIFKKDYHHYIEKHSNNTDEILRYFRLPIRKEWLVALIRDENPSLDWELRDGNLVRIYAIHPTPPVQNTKSSKRAAEILIVTKRRKSMGHNAWSSRTIITKVDPIPETYFWKSLDYLYTRRGYGIFSTFHAKYFFLGWHLDLIFVSQDFTLKKTQVHRCIGSDHFPINTNLVPNPIHSNGKISSEAGDKEEADEKISNGKEA